MKLTSSPNCASFSSRSRSQLALVVALPSWLMAAVVVDVVEVVAFVAHLQQPASLASTDPAQHGSWHRWLQVPLAILPISGTARRLAACPCQLGSGGCCGRYLVAHQRQWYHCVLTGQPRKPLRTMLRTAARERHTKFSLKVTSERRKMYLFRLESRAAQAHANCIL